MRADDGSALSPLSTAVMAYIRQLLQGKAQVGVPTAASAAAERTQSKAMLADETNRSAPAIRKQVEAGPNTSASTAVRRMWESDAAMNGASVQDSHPVTFKQEQIEPEPSMSASAAVQQHPEADAIVNGASVQDSHPTTVKQEQIEPDSSTSANAAIPFAGGESAGDVKLKKIAKVELQRGHKSWYTGTIPASLKVTEESGETREIFHFAQLDGCLVDEMVFECRDKTTDKLVRQPHKDNSIGVHVKRLVVRKLGGGQSYDHFESGIKRLQDLAEGLRSLQLIVWEGTTEKHLFKLSSFVNRKLVFEYPVDLDDVEMTRENFAEYLRRAREPPVKVEKYFTLPAPLHIHIDSFGGHLYEMMMLSLIESLHKVHKDDGNVVTLARPVPPTHYIRGFWLTLAASLFEYVITGTMSDVKDITFHLELDYRDGAREEFEKFAKAVGVKPTDGDSLKFTAKHGPYEIRCAFTLEPSITVTVYGARGQPREEVQENSLVSISIVKRE